MNEPDVSAARSAQFRRLYSRHFRSVWSIVGQLGLHGAAREDAVQEVWLIAYRRLHTLDPEASARAWLGSIARRVAWRTRRTAQRLDRRVNALAEEPQSVPADACDRYEAATTVRNALESLSEEQRRVLVLTTLHGFTAPEVADVLEVPVNTVYSRLRLARRRLADFSVRQQEVEAALEARERPPSQLRQRVLGAVLPGVPVPLLGAASTIKAFAFGGVVGGLAVAVTVAAAPEPRPVSAPAHGEPAASVPAVVATAAPVADPSLVPPFEPEPTREPVPTPESSPSLESAPPPPRRTPGTPVAAAVEPEPATTPTPTAPTSTLAVGAESELLSRAQRALRSEQPRQALRLLRQHELQYPDGALVDVREGVVVRALCAAGRTTDAVARVRDLNARSPDSPVATAVEDVCGGR